ncbi:hypothetical protein ACH5RR_037020 [Cinchona calisaya]|uniref:Uncharacterized protein n=1 Tax=Cinchona calisaya TaxID=153742 RepID=A0ABD2Y784_9GENT
MLILPRRCNVVASRVIEEITGMRKKALPITYLGCPLYVGRKKLQYFHFLIVSVVIDSSVLRQMTSGESSIAWRLDHTMHRIEQLLNSGNFIVQHVFLGKLIKWPTVS